MFTTWPTRTNLTLLWSRMNQRQILILENGKEHLSFLTNPIVNKPYDRNDTRKIKNYFRCVARKKKMISHFGYWHFLSTANTGSVLSFLKAEWKVLLAIVLSVLLLLAIVLSVLLLLAIVLSVLLQFTDSEYPFNGIFKLFSHL